MQILAYQCNNDDDGHHNYRDDYDDDEDNGEEGDGGGESVSPQCLCEFCHTTIQLPSHMRMRMRMMIIGCDDNYYENDDDANDDYSDNYDDDDDFLLDDVCSFDSQYLFSPPVTDSSLFHFKPPDNTTVCNTTRYCKTSYNIVQYCTTLYDIELYLQLEV